MQKLMMIVQSPPRGPDLPLQKPLMDAIGKLSEEATNAGTMVGMGAGPNRPGCPRPAFVRGKSA